MIEKRIRPARLNVKFHKKSCVLSIQDEYLYHPFYVDNSNEKALTDSKRGKIKGCSFKSKRSARLLLEDHGEEFITKACLTYPEAFPMNGKEVKNHLQRLIKRMYRYCGDLKYFWILEFQERGAPHLHLLLDKYIPKDWLSKAWYEVVRAGDPRHLAAGTFIKKIDDPDHDIGYLTTYLGKEYQKNVPDGFGDVGRFWGSNMTLKENLTLKLEGDYNALLGLYRAIQTRYLNDRLNLWSKQSGKAYTFDMLQRPGFTAWASNDMIKEMIQKAQGGYYGQEDAKSDTKGYTDVFHSTYSFPKLSNPDEPRRDRKSGDDPQMRIMRRFYDQNLLRVQTSGYGGLELHDEKNIQPNI